MTFLESISGTSGYLNEETAAMWQTLGTMALAMDLLPVAERCYAALGDVAKARYLRETYAIAEESAAT